MFDKIAHMTREVAQRVLFNIWAFRFLFIISMTVCNIKFSGFIIDTI